jgi:hypothetical protein
MVIFLTAAGARRFCQLEGYEGDVMLLSAAGMRRYCQLEGYIGTASCMGCYFPDSCRGE